MILHADDIGVSRLHTDVCVIGAGAAGLTLSTELAHAGVQCIVLEGGLRAFDPATQALYDSDVVGLAHGGIHAMRFRTFGGTTTRWAGQALPLSDLDFQTRAWVPLSGWPIDRGILKDYYLRAASVMSIPPFAPHPGVQPAGVPSPPAFDAQLLEPLVSEFSPKPNFASTLGPALDASPHARIILGANVVELLTHSNGTKVDLAEVRSLSGASFQVGARVFVVCCGGIETARLLLVSDRFAKGGLGNHSGVVGRYFQDHPVFRVGPIISNGSHLDPFHPVRHHGVKYLLRVAASTRLQHDEQLLNVSGMVNYEQAQAPSINSAKLLVRALHRPELRGQTWSALSTIIRQPRPVVAAAARYFLLQQPALDTSGQPVLTIVCEQAPNPDSRVFLVDSRDALGVRRVALDWRLAVNELRTSHRLAEVIASEFERLGLGTIAVRSFVLPADPKRLSDLVVDSGHHMGTTRMGVDPSHAVVDSDCKVFGFENLYIASCSVFPTGGSSNPTFTLLALTLRLADRIRALA